MYKKIVYATDFSKHSQAAFKQLQNVCECSKPDEVFVVHIIAHSSLAMETNMEGFASPHLSEIRDTLKKHFIEDSEKRMDTIVRVLRDMNIHTEQRIYEGVPHNEITKIADEEDCDLIIIGSHGKSQFEEFFIGSTTEKILRKANCPVLVVR
ncbi:MAG: universal stress protein [Candidatus Zixiibacteriota bacterium]